MVNVFSDLFDQDYFSFEYVFNTNCDVEVQCTLCYYSRRNVVTNTE